MKRLLAFALALTLFAAPAVALAEDYNRAEDEPAESRVILEHTF